DPFLDENRLASALPVKELHVLMIVRTGRSRRTNHRQRVIAITCQELVGLIEQRHAAIRKTEMYQNTQLLDGVNEVRACAEKPEDQIEIAKQRGRQSRRLPAMHS